MGELYIKFIVVSLVKCERKRSLIEKILLKHRLNHKKRLLEKPLFEEKDCTVMGRHGVEVELPFTETDILNMEPDYLETYIRKILDIYDIPGCYLKRELSFLNERLEVNKKWIFSYLLFRQGIDLFLAKNNVSKKDARFVIIDKENHKVELILQVILEYANYLTIITDRSHYFQKAVDVVYEETGLMMDVVSSSEKKKINGNVIINLNSDYYQVYSLVEDGAIVVDLAFSNRKLEYLSNRKKDLEILFDYEITAGGEAIEQELMAEVLVRDNWKISRFAKRAEASLSPNEIASILREYDMKIVKLKTVTL